MGVAGAAAASAGVTPPGGGPGARAAAALRAICLAAITLLGFVWLTDAPVRWRWPFIDEHLYLTMAGLATAAGFLKHPAGSRRRAGWLECLLAVSAIALWVWGAVQYEDWLILGGNAPSRWVPAMASCCTSRPSGTATKRWVTS